MLKKLLRKGLDEIRPYVPGKGKDSVPKGIKAIKLASNENPLGPSPRVLAAIKEIDRSAINIYPDSTVRKLKSAISKYIGVKEGAIVVGNGSDEVLELAVKIFLNRDEKAIIPVPTFSLYENLVKLHSGKPVFVNLKPGFRYDRRTFVDKIDKATKLIFVCSPNNPTGGVISREDLEGLLAEDAVVILDEAYAEFADQSHVKLVREHENLVVLRTFSKAFGLAGLRIGYAVTDEAAASYMERVKLPFSVSTLAQAAAMSALGDKEHLKKSILLAKKGREYLYKELSEIPGVKVFPSHANFLLAKTIGRKNVSDALFEKGIIVRDCGGFRGLSSEYFRVSVGTQEENDLFIAALKEISG